MNLTGSILIKDAIADSYIDEQQHDSNATSIKCGHFFCSISHVPLVSPTSLDTICADVRPLLREVFRDVDYLPPLTSCLSDKNDESELLEQRQWIDEFSAECRELNEKEKKLKFKYAERLSRQPLPNIYKMYTETGSGDQESLTIVRKDLKPTIEQDAACDARLWVKNILNRSSGDLTREPYERHIQSKTVLLPVDNTTIQSYSIGAAVPPQPPLPPKLMLQPPLPEYMICMPPRIEFVNFILGNVHTESVRLINISKFELRLSVSPPKRRELDIELCSRLVVTSGSAAELKIHYRPVDVLSVTDELLVRVSAGKSLRIPIACYMQPPILEILVPNLMSIRLESMKTAEITRDVLDLGSRLLGDVHRASLLFYCAEKHANFFLLPEDAWISFCVDIAASSGKGKSVGGAASDSFWLSPVRWSGGGTTRALAVCYATEPGLHTTALRILCSTAIVRPLNVVADALWFRADHITLEAHDKDYDIRSDDDEACDYYVRLGTAFPSRSLCATVEILNHSPVTYPYYWSIRPWGICSCWTASQTSLFGEDDLCDEAKMNRSEMKTQNIASEDAKAVRVEAAQGRLFPRSVTQLMVRVPDVGHVLGTHRAVLMLILKEIPKESFQADFDPMIVKTDVVNEEGIPGVCASWSREICDVVCCQLEVWWEVVPVRFVLDPPVLKLRHSRRVKSTDICLKATQLYGVSGVKANWNVSGANTINLQPGEPIATQFNLQMQPLPNHFPDTDVIQLSAESKEWKCSSFIQRQYDTRHPSLRPAFKWLGLVPPGAKVQTELVVHNDTHQHICWWATCIRWWGERRVATVCAGREPCPQCYERSCSCAMLTPTRGALAHDESVVLKYSVIAPDTDGVVATLVQVHRTSGDVCMVHTVAGTEARATLLAYRVLAPRVVMRVMPCLGNKHGHCKVCSLDTDDRKDCAVLRPSFPLTVGFRSCYRIKCSNLNPLPTTVKFQKPLDGEDSLKVIFIPNDFDLQPHSSINIQIVLDPRKVSSRRVYMVHANVCHAYKPIYLLIDTAISGLEVVIDIPLGGAESTDSFVSMKIMEKEISRENKKLTPKEVFEEEDRKRAVLKENICHCRYKMMYIPPVKQSPQDIDEEYHCVDIITEPPALTRVCPCVSKTMPILPEPTETYCLQFRSIPLKTVRSRVVTIRNVSSISGKITTAVRRFSRVHKRTINKDKWANDVQEPGIVIECAAPQHILSPCGQVDVTVSVYADCWGLYYDQVLIKIDRLDPLVLDVWIEAVGAPLHFPLQGLNPVVNESPAVLWMSPSDPQRALHVSNTSRSSLNIHSYIITEHEYPQDELPFRLYIRFYDVLPRTCPCVTDSESLLEDSEKESSVYVEMDTEIELFLARDYGMQDNAFYTMEPKEFTIGPNSSAAPLVTLSNEPTPPPSCVILMRILPISNRQGPYWYRPEPAPLVFRLLAVPRSPKLLVLPTKLHVQICALDLPENDLLRVRKRIRILNTGSGRLQTYAVTENPWLLRIPQEQCLAKCIGSGPGSHTLDFELLPASSTEMAVEVTIMTNDIWPKPGEEYESYKHHASEIKFFDEQNIFLMSIPLYLDIEFPKLQVEPSKIDFGYVMDGDYRKSYFTLMQTSSNITLEVAIECCGDKEYRIWPPRLTLVPRTRERVYVQYISKLQLWPAEGAVRIRALSAAGAWCMNVVVLHAQSTLDRATHLPAHDYTDDSHLSTH